MLTLKAPVQLHIGQALTTSTEAFGERIMGNYNILNAKIAPKELLLLLTATPEVLEEQGGMTTLVNNDTRVDLSNVTVDVVNNVINRILLDGSSSFTYQDQVYITSVLNRLGIHNVEQFMTQIRQLRIETENTRHMTGLYRRELERILRYQTGEDKLVRLPAPSVTEAEAQAQTDPTVEMSLQILNRLGASNLYETLYLFQKNVTRAENQIQHNELRLAEHLRLSNELSLTEVKQKLFEQPSIHLAHHVNHYELGTIMEAPQSEEAVLSQAAVAALVSAVDNTITTQINRTHTRQEQWMRLEKAIWQTAANSVSRFESYHNHYETLPAATELNVATAWNRYATEMRQYLTLRQFQNQRMEQSAVHNVFLQKETNETSYAETNQNYYETSPAMAAEQPQQAARKAADVDVRQYLTHQQVENQRLEQSALHNVFLQQESHETSYAETNQNYYETSPAAAAEHPEEAARKAADVDVRQYLTHQQVENQRLEQSALHNVFLQQERHEQSIVQHYDQNGHHEGMPPVLTELSVERLLHGADTRLQQYVTQAQHTNLYQEQHLSTENRFSADVTLTHLKQVEEENTFVSPQRTDIRNDRERLRTNIRELVRLQLAQRAGQAALSVENNRYSADLRQYLTLQQQENRQSDQYFTRQDLFAGDVTLTHLKQVEEENTFVSPQRTDIRLDRELQQTAIRELVNSQITQIPAEETAPLRQDILHHRERVLTEEHTTQIPADGREAPGKMAAEPQRGATISTVAPPVMPIPEPSLPPLELTAREAEEQAPQRLVEQIQQIDRQNQVVLQQIQTAVQSQPRQTPPVTVPDMQRTMRDSLRALTEPELVLREIYESVQPPPVQQPTYTAQEEAILRQASPSDRALYELVLAYERDPQAALTKGLLSPGNPAMLAAQIQKLQAPQPQVLEHLASVEEVQEVWEETETVLEKILHHTPRGVRTEEYRTEPHAVRIVHKQTPSDISEEWLEKLEQRNTNQLVKTEDNQSVTQRHTSHTEINNEEHKVIQRTTEDITELVNRTLAKQMRTISDQVYRQMEKRLQTERSRRGRF